MAAYDAHEGPHPPYGARFIDAMGVDITADLIFVETECGLCVRYVRDADGSILFREDGAVTKSETRPAPIQVVTP